MGTHERNYSRVLQVHPKNNSLLNHLGSSSSIWSLQSSQMASQTQGQAQGKTTKKVILTLIKQQVSLTLQLCIVVVSIKTYLCTLRIVLLHCVPVYTMLLYLSS